MPQEIGLSVLTVSLFERGKELVGAVVITLTLEGTDGVAGITFGV